MGISGDAQSRCVIDEDVTFAGTEASQVDAEDLAGEFAQFQALVCDMPADFIKGECARRFENRTAAIQRYWQQHDGGVRW